MHYFFLRHPRGSASAERQGHGEAVHGKNDAANGASNGAPNGAPNGNKNVGEKYYTAGELPKGGMLKKKI